MRITIRSVAVLAGVLCLGSFASAEPLPWGYQVFDPTGGFDRLTFQWQGSNVGEVRQTVAIPRPELSIPSEILPNPETYNSDTYTEVAGNTSRKVRVWMGENDNDHDAWRSLSWTVSRVYTRKADRSGWELTGTQDWLSPANADGQRSVIQFPNGEGDGLVNRVEMWNENGTMVLRMTPDVTPDVPEPATLALAAIGLGAVGLVRRRGRR